MPKRGKGLCGKGSCDNLSGLERIRGNASVGHRARGWRFVPPTLGGNFNLIFWPSVWAWRERRVCWPQQYGRLVHPGQSSTGWRTMIHHHAVAPRSGQAVCPGNWRRGPNPAGRSGRQLQAAGIQLAPVLDPVPFPEFLLASCTGRTMLGCLLLRFLSRRQQGATGTGPAGLRRQSP